MTPTERRVAEIMSRFGYQLAVEDITPTTAMAQDARIDGIDVDDFVNDLQTEFGSIVREIPWSLFSDQRASFRGYGCFAVPFWLIARSIVAPLRGERVIPRADSSDLPRLTVGHIAKVIDQGRWTEPDSLNA